MDTDDLSNESHDGIIIEAERFNHDLTLQFGVLASSCKNEEERQIDLIVYKLYDLSYNEVKIVDPEFELTKEEYEKYG